ncbi:serine hydrolase domain-containing protein [Roseibium aggregatum]|uniref:Serine hydrolase n=1 Tax=Roseibium aggregatum TaxID=187304 RepID=A0A926SA02_9HYPH|nr:serine hydrolase [Roseibium aggregatum]MBD1547944.1 serine hydrolase [Roseibium aggregatum]
MNSISTRYFTSRRLGAGVAAFLALVLLALVLTAWRAPQLLVLAGEGFPGPTWPAPGNYATVQGTTLPEGQAPAQLPGVPVQTRFEESGGRALLMERGGVLQTEIYRDGVIRDTRLNSYSLVKSLVGALVLRAVADGRIKSLDAPLRQILGADAPDVTVGEVLTMSSGLVMVPEPPKTEDTSADDHSFSPFGPLARIHAYGIEKMMPELRVDRNMEGHFHYQSANTALLGVALERVYNQSLPDLLSSLIWKPAGAADAHWRRYPAGRGVSAYCCLYARPLDWIRVGRFLLDNGTLGKPFLPQALWRDFLMPNLDAQARRQGAYGDQVRHDVLDRPGEQAQGPFAYFMGLDGQMVYLLPKQDAVVVRFGERVQLLHSTLYELFPKG